MPTDCCLVRTIKTYQRGKFFFSFFFFFHYNNFYGYKRVLVQRYAQHVIHGPRLLGRLMLEPSTGWLDGKVSYLA